MDIKLSSAGKKFWNTKKHTIRVEIQEKLNISCNDTSWSGGSRSGYYIQTKLREISNIPHSVNPSQFGGFDTEVTIEDFAVVQHSIFCGKEMPLRIYINSQEGWIF